jgi:hypothetical protein
VPVCAGLCRFVPVCAGLCRFVPVCAGLCRFVPQSHFFAADRLLTPFSAVENNLGQKGGNWF